MPLEFFRVSQAIEYTIGFYRIDRIKEYMFKFAEQKKVKVTTSGSSNREWHEIVLGLQSRMDDEITQHMSYSNAVALAYLFDTLESWLTDYRFESVWIPNISHEIEQYNNQVYEDFLLKQEEAEEKFKATENYSKYKHLDKIPVVHKMGLGLAGYFNFPSGHKFEYTTEEEYKRFIIAHCPPLIDTAYLQQYVYVVKELIDNFKGIVNKHIKLYQSLKNNLPPAQTPSLLPAPYQPGIIQPSENKKVRVKLSVEQLTFLFRLLKDGKIIESKVDKDIHAFIAENFETVGREGVKISAKNIGRLWSSTDTDLINFWVKKFIDLSDIANKK